jgi:chitodextrinase
LKSHATRALRASGFFRLLILAALIAVGVLGENASRAATATIAFVQGKGAAPGGLQRTVSATFSSAQGVGNLNIVVIGYSNGKRRVQSVKDSRGNTYILAAGPTVNSAAQSIYYARNILPAAANTNTVTVTLDDTSNYVDLRIAEYKGIGTASPLDKVAVRTGVGTSANSGSATTKYANELLVGAGYSGATITGPGSGFTRRVTTANTNILEDRIVSSLGTYSATATVSPSVFWIMQMVTFRAANVTGGDTQPPTAPTNLAATATSSSRINLTWTASTDNVGVTGYRVERCQGASCTSFVQIATATGTTYSDTTLSASTAYRYRVRAADAAAQLSSYSNIASATTLAPGDTQAPTAPSGLAAAALSSTQIDLSWTASTDDVGVTAYLIERCQGSGCTSFAQIASTTSTNYSNTGLTPSTTYAYRVRATDAAMNRSGYSNTATATVAVALAASQANSSAPQTTTSSVTATFLGAQTAGDTNVVAIGWRTPSANVQSVTDTRGNVYVLAVGPTVLQGLGAHALYYSSGISAAASGGNTVTVTFSAPAALPDVRIAEYSGIDTSAPIDTIATATGNSSISDSGTITTYAPNTLIVAANLATALTTSAGAGYTARAISSPNGNILEDRIVSTAGNYNATAPLSSAGPWIMQVAAFRWVASPPCD